MNLVRDYLNFAAWLLGIGYVVLWPFTALPASGAPLAAAQVCALAPLRFLCALPHPLSLPLGLQIIGGLSAVWVILRLAMRGIAHLRQARAPHVAGAATLGARLSVAAARTPRRRPAPPLRTVKPRSQFGLRGTER
jgi:amino acid transporter